VNACEASFGLFAAGSFNPYVRVSIHTHVIEKLSVAKPMLRWIRKVLLVLPLIQLCDAFGCSLLLPAPCTGWCGLKQDSIPRANSHLLFSLSASASSNSGPNEATDSQDPIFSSQITSHARFRDIADRNDFERQVCARLGEYGGEQLEKLVLGTQSAVNHANEFSTNKFLKDFNTVFASGKGTGLGEAAKIHQVSDQFELDLCLKIGTTAKINDLFDQCCDDADVVAFLPTANGFVVEQGFRETPLDADSFVHFEVTRPPAKLNSKLYQLECARRLEADCVPSTWGSASAVGIFVNGDREAFLARADILRKQWQEAADAGLHITKVPFYLAFTPFRNLYSALRDVKDGQQKLESGQQKLEREIGELKRLVQQLVDK